MLVGEGPQQGVNILHKANNADCFVWDNTLGQAARGTGGGLKNITILKGDGYSGGDAIKLYATSINNRPGEMVFDNVLIYGTGTGLWTRGFHLDGTDADVPGGRGVRSVHLRKVRVASCTEDYEYILINQGTHVVGLGVQIDTSGGTGATGMTIKGTSDGIYMTDLAITGTLLIEEGATNVVITGRPASLNVQATTCNGSFTGSLSGTLVNKSPNFTIDGKDKPGFLAYLNTTASNVTGDGAEYTVLFNTEAYDINSDYVPATGTFTASCAGRYRVSWQVTLAGVTAAETRHDIGLFQVGGANANYIAIGDPQGMGETNGIISVMGSVVVQMAYGDTLNVRAQVRGGLQVVDILGASTRNTYFCAELI